MRLLAQAGCEGAICQFFQDRGASDAVARFLDTVLSPWPRVLLIVVFAVLIRAVGRGLMERFARRAMEGERKDHLRRLRERVRDAVDGPGTLLPDVPSVRKAQRIRAMTDLAESLFTVLVWTVAVMMILSEFGVDVGPMIASAGILGIALGFGAQDLVKDFLSGVFMLAEDQYGVGDVIDVGEAVGEVAEISLRTTSIRGVDGTMWHVPNGEIRRVGNMSQEWARALLDIGVGYHTDIEHAVAVVERVAAEVATDDAYRPYFLAEPDVQGVQDLSADAILIRLVIKTTPGDQMKLSRELRRRIKEAFDAEGIEIPFPQRTIWVRNEAGDDAASALGVGDAPRVTQQGELRDQA